MGNIDFAKTGFAGQMDFIVVQHSATKNGLPSNNQFYFQSNIVMVNLV
jgi:hypothetical protein